MDYKRIEWIFLVVFVAIDIFLGIGISMTPAQLNTPQSTETVSINQEMAADNITLPKKVATAPEDGYYLAVKTSNGAQDDLRSRLTDLKNVSMNYEASTRQLTVTLNQPILLSSHSKQALKQVEAFKNKKINVPYGTAYTYVPILSNDQSYVFIQKSSFGAIFDERARLTINVKDHRIVGYVERHLGQIGAVRERQATVSASHAVKALYTYSELPNNSRVRWIKLCYSELTEVRGNTIFLPTWVVAVENKSTKTLQIKRVNAFSGTVMSAEPSD